MSSVKAANTIVKYKVGKNQFEIICKPGTVQLFRDGKIGYDKVMQADVVFTNASKFLKAGDTELINSFETSNQEECIKTILIKGEFSLTKKEMQDKVDIKRRELLHLMHKHYHDPRSSPAIPHPEARLVAVLDEMKYHVDPFESCEKQLKVIDKKITDFIPVKRMPLVESDYEEAKNFLTSRKAGKDSRKEKLQKKDYVASVEVNDS